MVGRGVHQTMHLSVGGLRLPGRRDRFEVWLLDTRTGRTHEIGVVPREVGHVRVVFRLPAAEVAGYNAVDVSLQTPADDGHHSNHSVLRGTIG